jgi:hypothetical protein
LRAVRAFPVPPVAAEVAAGEAAAGRGGVVAETEMASARLPGEIVAALKKRAEENGESLSDMLRRGALMVLGICPTCGQKAPEAGKDAAREKAG